MLAVSILVCLLKVIHTRIMIGDLASPLRSGVSVLPQQTSKGVNLSSHVPGQIQIQGYSERVPAHCFRSLSVLRATSAPLGEKETKQE